MNILKWFKKDKKEEHVEKFALVKILDEPIYIAEKNKHGRFYFKLYESDLGNRKVQLATTITDIRDYEYVAKQYEIYHTKVLRWRDGRHDPDIPRYSEVGEEDIVNALKGKIE